ncbi:GSCOCG00009747001-RA-CDS [Cotesia congregata]|nr:GSCOCG00009747001-RA-CDS [Cotesia congregata]
MSHQVRLEATAPQDRFLDLSKESTRRRGSSCIAHQQLDIHCNFQRRTFPCD